MHALIKLDPIALAHTNARVKNDPHYNPTHHVRGLDAPVKLVATKKFESNAQDTQNFKQRLWSINDDLVSGS